MAGMMAMVLMLVVCLATAGDATNSTPASANSSVLASVSPDQPSVSLSTAPQENQSVTTNSLSTARADAMEATGSSATPTLDSARTTSQFKDVIVEKEGKALPSTAFDDEEDDESADGVALAIAGFFAAFFGVFGLLSALLVTFLWRHLSKQPLAGKRNSPAQQGAAQQGAGQQTLAHRTPSLDLAEGVTTDWKPIMPIMPIAEETPHVPATPEVAQPASSRRTRSSSTSSRTSQSSRSSSNSGCSRSRSGSRRKASTESTDSSSASEDVGAACDSSASSSALSATFSVLEQECSGNSSGNSGVVEIAVPDIRITVN